MDLPQLTDVDSAVSPIALLPFVYVYLSLAYGLFVANFQPILLSALAIGLIFVWDMYGNAVRRQREAQDQRDFYIGVLRKINPLQTGESNMSKDIDRLMGGRLFSYAEIKRISARLIKASMDNLVSEQKLKAEDRDLLCEHLAKMCNLWELYPKKTCYIPPNQEVKDAIKARILRVSPGAIDPVNIPGAKIEAPAEPARGFARLLRRKTA